MEDRAFEQMLRRALGQDLSAGTEAFRDALLKRCLSVLESVERDRELSDDDLDLLAAAGDPNAAEANSPRRAIDSPVKETAR